MIQNREQEVDRIRVLLTTILVEISEVLKSQLWSYTREHELGRLDVAKYAIKSVLEDL